MIIISKCYEYRHNTCDKKNKRDTCLIIANHHSMINIFNKQVNLYIKRFNKN